MAVARVGISGWRYAPWRGGAFYPKGLPQRLELEYASERLDSIEVNGTFYGLQRPSSFETWRDTAPPDFVFSVKGSRYISHILGLRDARTALANFFAQGLLALGEKLGPVLWQLPERHAFDPGELEAFLRELPKTTGEASALAHRHDTTLNGRSWLRTDHDRPLRHALEVRNLGFDVPQFFDILSENGVSAVMADTAGRWPSFTTTTADFVYVRLHGSTELYASGYGDDELDHWARRIRGWLSTGKDVYVYFDNDMKVRSPVDAMALRERLGAATARSPAPAAES
ncbi:DUF72 domain-containing protein [Compostimonas suwonensis]|uniref:Uncharacterized protein YecE (DUF72 family) n=1 Tax=Compostimonas suwonensis TaxID=1048394 RepID=A0A2M9C3R2_9MICO|nr:DUF72 domain-containing protein [Compostimonas suwonensis]PJJ65170.1 uncharacterized protein YecE (DUF72 family) [Compostimonas suwonensis]